MRLIDKDGKIFGKINILDFTVLFLVLLILVAIFTDKFFPNRTLKRIRRMPQQRDYIAEIILDQQRSWLVEYIKPGDGQKDVDDNFIAEVIGVEKVEIMDNLNAAVVTLRLRASLDSNGFVTYGNNILRRGNNFALETKNYLITGIVYRVEEYTD